MDLKEIQKALADRFPVDQVKQREAGFGGKKLDYIGIDSAIGRLNDVLPMGYSWIVNSTCVLEGAVVVTGTLEITLQDGDRLVTVRRSGIGADTVSAKDMDKSVKTAYAEAFKKACNTLGVALYLWDADERADIARERQNGTVESKRTFTSQQLEKMKYIRTNLKLTTDDELNKFLKEQYKNTKVNKKTDLTPDNIEEFFADALPKVAALNPKSLETNKKK